MDCKKRIDTALKYYNPGTKIILSGGYGTSATIKKLFDKNTRSEASYMHDYITKKVKGNDIIVEDKSRDTIGNAFFSKQLVKNAQKIYVVTSDFHILRTKYIFYKIFKQDIEFIPATTNYENREKIILEEKITLQHTINYFNKQKKNYMKNHPLYKFPEFIVVSILILHNFFFSKFHSKILNM